MPIQKLKVALEGKYLEEEMANGLRKSLMTILPRLKSIMLKWNVSLKKQNYNFREEKPEILFREKGGEGLLVEEMLLQISGGEW